MAKFPKSSFLKKTCLVLVFLIGFLLSQTDAQKHNFTLLVGTYTRETSEGIYSYNFNSKTGKLDLKSIKKGLTNPSFMAFSPDHSILYTLNGVNLDSVIAFRIDQNNDILQTLNTQPLEGGFGACHLAVDHSGKWLIVGNYKSGSISVLSIESDGKIGKLIQTIKHTGSSINAERQTQAAVHSINIAKNNVDVFVPDLGMDKIMSYKLNAITGILSPADQPFVSTSPGAGPRHFTFSPNNQFAYVINELNCTVGVYQYSQGKLKEIQVISTLPKTYNRTLSAADIHISQDGKYLYASNRIHESLTVFKINQKNGTLKFVQNISVLGTIPRNFVIDPTGNYVLVANQTSNNIVVFKRNKRNGRLKANGEQVNVSLPVCLKFI